MKYKKKYDVTINSFQTHNAIFCDVTKGIRIKKKKKKKIEIP